MFLQTCYLEEKWYGSVIVFIKPGSAVLHADKTSFIRFGICYPSPRRKYIYPLPVGSENERWWYLNNLNVTARCRKKVLCNCELIFLYCHLFSFPTATAVCGFAVHGLLCKYLQKWDCFFGRLLENNVYVVEMGQSMCLENSSGWTWKLRIRHWT